MLSIAQINDQNQYLILTEAGVVSLKNSEGATQITVDPELFENWLFHTISLFFSDGRVHLTLSVSDKFKQDFILIRGLVEFHRPKHLLFSYDAKHRSVGIDITLNQFGQLRTFLSQVFEWVVKEKQFRYALKLAIEMENRYRLERDSIYGILKNSTAALHAVD